jgi:hypothetical protein
MNEIADDVNVSATSFDSKQNQTGLNPATAPRIRENAIVPEATSAHRALNRTATGVTSQIRTSIVG